MIAWLVAGQGAETAGMGLWLAERSERARRWLALAGAEAGVDAVRVLTRGGPDFGRTEVIQPLLTAVALATAAELADAGVRADRVAGYSLGEVAAWSIAGGVAPEDAIRLAAARGRAMRAVGGAMAHVRGITADPSDDVRIGVYLGGGEAVLTGPGVDAWLRDHVGQRLATGGAWHGPWLADTRRRWAADLAAVSPRPLTTTLVSADTGEPVAADQVVEHLLSQLVSPLRWERVARNLAEAGVRAWVVVGPGRPVRYALRTCVPDARIHRTGDAASFAATVRALGR